MLNADEVKTIIERIEAIWPKRFTEEQVVIILDGLNSFTFDESLAALKDCGFDVGYVGVGEIVTRAKIIAGENARAANARKEPSKGCDACINGKIFAIDTARPGNYEFVFLCPCSSGTEQNAIPVWGEKYAMMGFRRTQRLSASDKARTTKQNEEITCQKCGHHVADRPRFKIEYK